MATLTFAVRRRDPELVGSARPTPRETKHLPDIDDREVIRRQMPNVYFYRGGSRADDDPAGVIRRALGEALVPYYPLAGRLREVEARKLVVDCTGDGVLFVEADADLRLAGLQAATGGLRPPFPCMDQLLYDVEGSSGLAGCPLLLIQVTQLLCGGFAFAFRLNHVMCDAIGVTQFISAVAELARGLPAPTVPAAWSRELLEARSPRPKPAFPHSDSGAVTMPPPPQPFNNMVLQTFTFSPADVAALKKVTRLPSAPRRVVFLQCNGVISCPPAPALGGRNAGCSPGDAWLPWSGSAIGTPSTQHTNRDDGRNRLLLDAVRIHSTVVYYRPPPRPRPLGSHARTASQDTSRCASSPQLQQKPCLQLSQNTSVCSSGPAQPWNFTARVQPGAGHRLMPPPLSSTYDRS
ncbi:Benzyl alcohol O-benzoyltransferase [Dichanthelium oligosanthes]|uniref:Benzyl alcohol O-benzoyltransferase n=1 Tax=Dichanthelium oligosanthes TaxID=888268 RepID=A0A1E5VV22_9POAL|nr:Benzyl alcohol O-benzoyltransferase [Dichanthelium oligosanthes]